jgi:chemotaxis protein CheD
MPCIAARGPGRILRGDSGGSMDVVVDIAGLAVSTNAGETLIAPSVGGCIAVAIWDPVARVAGLLHYMLPDSAMAPEKATAMPAMFCDTGVQKLFRSAYELGAKRKQLVVKVAGGSQLLDEGEPLSLSKRNYLALRKVFWKNGVLIDAEDVGGSASRTLRIRVADGYVTVRTRGSEVPL